MRSLNGLRNAPLRRARARIFTQLGALAAFFLFLCCLSVGIFLVYTLKFIEQRSMQINNREFAENLAVRWTPLLEGSSDIAAIRGELELLRLLRPDVSVFLLDRDGRLLDPYAAPHPATAFIDLDPIEAYLQDSSWKPPLRTVKRPFTSGEMVFSAARLDPDTRASYLLVSLQEHSRTPVESLLQLDSLTWSAQGAMLFIVILTFVFAAYVFFLLSRKFFELHSVVMRFKEGDYSVRSSIRSGNELGELSDAINAMADTIEQNIAELKGKDELRRRLIANISHDLRSPIAGMVSHADALKERLSALSREDIERRLEGFVVAGDAVTALVQELFELSKFEAKEIKPSFKNIKPRTLLDSAEKRFVAQAEEKNVQLSVRVHSSAEDASMQADAALLSRVFDNLLGNALRHTPTGGHIELGVSLVDEQLQFYVRDSGFGIPEQHIQEIFKPKVSVGNPRGMGLGLAIVSEILKLHGSEISVTSVEGQGSTFQFAITRSEPS